MAIFKLIEDLLPQCRHGFYGADHLASYMHA